MYKNKIILNDYKLKNLKIVINLRLFQLILLTYHYNVYQSYPCRLLNIMVYTIALVIYTGLIITVITLKQYFKKT